MPDVVTGTYTGEISPDFPGDKLVNQLAGIRTLINSREAKILAEGRNLNARLSLSVDNRNLDVVIKSFGRQSAIQNMLALDKGSKARRTWNASLFLKNSGVGTPAPIAFLERWDGRVLPESYFISEFQSGISSFRNELLHLFWKEPECSKVMTLIQCVADAVREMHKAGFLHNDLGNQNILLRRIGESEWGDVQFIDLNRGRIRKQLTDRERARDISRIYLPSDLLRVFKDMYWGGGVPSDQFLKWEQHYRRRFAFHSATRKYRHPLRTFRKWKTRSSNLSKRTEKDLCIWDKRSGQPIITMNSKDRSRYYPFLSHFKVITAILAGLLPVWRIYSKLKSRAYSNPVCLKDRMGIAVSPSVEKIDRQFQLLEQLGAIPVLIRFYHHETKDQWDYNADIVRQLHNKGHAVSVAFIQNRNAIINPDKWRSFLDYVLGKISDCIEMAELGHAINRIKWGIWGMVEYKRFIESSVEISRNHPSVSFIGPAVIDFEYQYLLPALKCLPRNFRFAALSHHLYVDRRGAPENRQGGFSSLEKFALARAIANYSDASESKLIISEVNWPIKGTGVYSPVGAPYVSPQPRLNDPGVSEDDYADYMIRYLLIAICSGFVDKVYWWRLVAKGYGLVDDTNSDKWIERPAFLMFKTFLKTVGEAKFIKRTDFGIKGVQGYLFETPEKQEICVTYSMSSEISIELPFSSACVMDAFGQKIKTSPNSKICLSGRPVYIAEGK